jgi:hypothetical protein
MNDQVNFGLIKYDTACKALAEAKSVDEVLKIRNVSVAMKAYAKQANNHEMEAVAIEIRMRATRRLDEMRQEQKATLGLAKGGGDQRSDHRGKKSPGGPPTLTEAGISKDLAKKGRKLGAMSKDEFEDAVQDARDKVNRTVKEVMDPGSTGESTRAQETKTESEVDRLTRLLSEANAKIKDLEKTIEARDAKIASLAEELEILYDGITKTKQITETVITKESFSKGDEKHEKIIRENKDRILVDFTTKNGRRYLKVEGNLYREWSYITWSGTFDSVAPYVAKEIEEEYQKSLLGHKRCQCERDDR